jgi:pyrroloquinoline-quinone synthase
MNLIETLKRDVDTHPVLENEWLQKVEKNLTLKDLKLWLSQEYYVSIDFVTWFLIAGTLTNDIDIRLILIENVWEELGEGKKENSHLEILKEFLVQIGYPVIQFTSFPKTKEYLNSMKTIISSNLYMALGALGPANEYLLKKEYGKMYSSYQLLKNKENLPDGSFFEVNLNADEGHSQKLFSLIENICDTNEKMKWVLEGNLRALNARKLFYEGLISQEIRFF